MIACPFSVRKRRSDVYSSDACDCLVQRGGRRVLAESLAVAVAVPSPPVSVSVSVGNDNGTETETGGYGHGTATATATAYGSSNYSSSFFTESVTSISSSPRTDFLKFRAPSPSALANAGIFVEPKKRNKIAPTMIQCMRDINYDLASDALFADAAFTPPPSLPPPAPPRPPPRRGRRRRRRAAEF